MYLWFRSTFLKNDDLNEIKLNWKKNLALRSLKLAQHRKCNMLEWILFLYLGIKTGTAPSRSLVIKHIDEISVRIKLAENLWDFKVQQHPICNTLGWTLFWYLTKNQEQLSYRYEEQIYNQSLCSQGKFAKQLKVR